LYLPTRSNIFDAAYPEYSARSWQSFPFLLLFGLTATPTPHPTVISAWLLFAYYLGSPTLTLLDPVSRLFEVLAVRKLYLDISGHQVQPTTPNRPARLDTQPDREHTRTAHTLHAQTHRDRACMALDRQQDLFSSHSLACLGQ